MAEEQKAGKIFLFCKESSQERIMKCLRDAFDVPGSAHDTGLELHNGNLNVTLRIYCESAGDEEQELVRSWSDRARGHFSRVETAVVDVKTNLLYQLEGTESIVSVDYVFEGEESEFLTETEEAAKRNMEQTLFRVLSDLRAVMAFKGEKRGFYCLDASGMEKLILDGNGNSEMERFLPYKAVGYVPGNEIETEQLNRREKKSSAPNSLIRFWMNSNASFWLIFFASMASENTATSMSATALAAISYGVRQSASASVSKSG